MSKEAGHVPMGNNPINHSGRRNLDCPHYVACLDRVASAQWPHFTCEFCAHRKNRRPIRLDNPTRESLGWEDIWGGGMSLEI
ncbi:hypothetical protein FAK_12440 [Desulfoferula mesophila]|uniref:Uncharacterized protein n=1 Tax=Desulfoferula mesophila TaxID=3058419 RepID=A0AAU9EAM2_9BACT|nr:hypothetical protein FAK_09300 [Desulfoferula mesophilus]BEQ14178.1 hypothetical protein FAK_12440 [Desulfoferula mesophilus]